MDSPFCSLLCFSTSSAQCQTYRYRSTALRKTFLRFIGTNLTVYGTSLKGCTHARMFVLQATLGTRYVRGRQRLYARMRSTCSYVKMERWKAEFFQLLRRPQALLLDSRYFPVVSFLLLLLDAVATTGIIWKVPCEPKYS